MAQGVTMLVIKPFSLLVVDVDNSEKFQEIVENEKELFAMYEAVQYASTHTLENGTW